MLRIYDPTQVIHGRAYCSRARANRAIALAYRLARETGHPQTKLMGYPFCFGAIDAFPCNVALVINPDRTLCAFYNAYFQQTQTPYVQVTLSPTGDIGQILVYRGQPCLSSLATDVCRPTSGQYPPFSMNGATHVCTRVVALLDEILDYDRV